MNQTAIRFSKVRYDHHGRTVVSIDSLTINVGERVALIGANGAGKSSLMKLMSGFYVPNEGVIHLFDHNLDHHTPSHILRALRREVGLIWQGLHLVGRLSALDNVLIGALSRVCGWRSWCRAYPDDEVRRALSYMRALGIVPLADLRTDRLSGGERQKIAIARLLLQSPRLMLADEATAALDPNAVDEVCSVMSQDQHSAQSTHIWVVHNPALIPRVADRVIGLKQGHIVLDCPASALNADTLSALYQQDPSDLPHAR